VLRVIFTITSKGQDDVALIKSNDRVSGQVNVPAALTPEDAGGDVTVALNISGSDIDAPEDY